MGPLSKSILLFVLNWLDAQLTLVWVRTNLATEGNGLMARLLNFGDNPFLIAKLLIGAFAAYVLYRCSHLPLARRGMQPEVAYGKLEAGPTFDATHHHPLLVPSTGDAYPNWTLEHFKKVVAYTLPRPSRPWAGTALKP